MSKDNSIDAIDKTKLTEKTKFRLSKIIGIENYFYQENLLRMKTLEQTFLEYKHTIQ